ncbi:hypothetical protein [Mycolicibacterium lacusdiani]|uniref:hypothetical protein n=1 Tax=Mycolicibacterium lacusdiani TaxID=2895283 RepID=UPI001F44DCA6|nr:hypothetical protein [Mycolicibacterium lacusdiani]
MAAPSPPVLLGALEKFTSEQGHTFAPVAGLVSADAEDIITAFARARFTSSRVSQPTGSVPQAIRATAESVLAPAISTPQVVAAAVVENVYKTIVTALLIPFAFAFFGIILVVSAIQNYFYNAGNAIAGSALASEPALSDVEPVTPVAGGPVENGPGEAAVSPAVTPSEPATGNEQTSTDTVASAHQVTGTHRATETPDAERQSTGPVAAGVPEPLSTEPASVPVNKTEPRTATGAVVRDSLGVENSPTDRPHSGNGGDATSEPAGGGDGEAAAGDSSDSRSSGADSSGGDSGDSR